jgi:hypothetical protein
MNTVIERELDMQLVLSPERSVLVPARLTYRADDPCAVHMIFHLGSQHPVRWVFARDLLVEGLFRPCGYGDVRIWPTRVHGQSVICLALSSPDGNALLEVPSAPVSSWLEATHRLTPPGAEERALRLDAQLARLLADS